MSHVVYAKQIYGMWAKQSDAITRPLESDCVIMFDPLVTSQQQSSLVAF